MSTKFFQHSDKSTWLTPSSIFVALGLEFDLDVAHWTGAAAREGRDDVCCR